MSKGTEQDQAGRAGGGASADPVWPVWGGGTPTAPVTNPEPQEMLEDSEPGADEAPTDAEPDDSAAQAEPTPDSKPDDSAAEAEPTADSEPDDSAGEPAADSKPDDSAAEREPTADSEPDDSAAEPATDSELDDSAAEPEPAPDSEPDDSAAEPEPIPDSEPAAADEAEPDEPDDSVVAPQAARVVGDEAPGDAATEPAPVVAPAAADDTEVMPSVVTAAGAVAPSAPAASPVAPPAPAAPPAQGQTPRPVSAPVAPPTAQPAPTAVVPPVAAPAPAATAGFAPVTAASAAAPSTIQSGRVPSSERAPSPFDVFEPEDRRRRWPRRLLIVGGIVLVLCAAYVGASYAVADTVPRGATVAGVDVGGLKSADAVTRLDTELADDTTQPIPVAAQDTQATLDPTAAGLTFDAQATVDELTGVNLGKPTWLWDHIVGVGEHDPVTAVDPKKLAAAIDGLGTSLQLLPVDGTIVYVDATAQSTDAVDGWQVDPQGAAKVVTKDWLVAPRPLKLPTTAVPPAITQETTDAALAEATKVTSAPVSVLVDGQVALLDAKTLAANASYVPTDGKLVLQMNGDGLMSAVLAQLPGLLTASADAHFEFVNDAPTIVPGTPGTTLDPKALAAAVSTAAVADNRSATVDLVQADPSESTAALEQLGVKEIVSEFSTPLTSEPRRTVNIANGASKINGTLIKPGETFSLTKALGPIDAAHGFVEAGAIVSGEHTDAWGGGLSQVSTTTYNAGFLAGYEDIEHKPHSEWFARYPEGREATIFTGTLDMRWKNNTPYGALVQAWVADNRVYVRVWSTKYWTVESITSPRSKVVQPTTVYSQSPTCEASAAGNPGFTVTVTRKTSLNGELKKTESNTWRYKPQNKTICGPAPTPTPAP